MGTARGKWCLLYWVGSGRVAAACLRKRSVVIAVRQLYGWPIVSRPEDSAVVTGRNVRLISSNHLTALGVGRPVILRTMRTSASLTIGDETGVIGVTSCSAPSGKVGKRCLLGADALNLRHSLPPCGSLGGRRAAPMPTPRAKDVVVIENEVSIGAKAVELPGATIGRGAVIGAGAVATGEVPPKTLAADDPAWVVRPWSSGG